MVRAVHHRQLWRTLRAVVAVVAALAVATSCSRAPEEEAPRPPPSTPAPAPAPDAAVTGTPPPSLNLRRARGSIESSAGAAEEAPASAARGGRASISPLAAAAGAMITEGFIVETTLQTAPIRATVTTVRRVTGDVCEVLTEATVFEDRDGVLHRGATTRQRAEPCDPSHGAAATAWHEALRDDLRSDRSMAAALKMAPTVSLRRHGIHWTRIARVSDGPTMRALLERLRTHRADAAETLAIAQVAWVRAGDVTYRYEATDDGLTLTAVELADHVKDPAP